MKWYIPEGYVEYFGENDHERNERLWVLENVPSGGTFIDVGANVGTWSMSFSRHFNSVYAIEPYPLNVEALMKNIELNSLTNIFVVSKAASSSKGKIFLSELWRKNDGGHVGTTAAQTQFESESFMIDELNLSPRLIKIDVEGWGAEVLKGATETLKRTDYVILELHDVEGDPERKFEAEVLSKWGDLVHQSDSGTIKYYRRKQ